MPDEEEKKVETTETKVEVPETTETVEVKEPAANDEMAKFMLDVMGQLANLTEKIEKLVPIEPAAETTEEPGETPEEKPADNEAPSEEEVDAIDKLLQSE